MRTTAPADEHPGQSIPARRNHVVRPQGWEKDGKLARRASGASRRPHKEDGGVAGAWDIYLGQIASGPVVRILPTVLKAMESHRRVLIRHAI